MSTQLLRIASVQERTGLARSTIYAKVADGTFPRPISLGGRSVAWLDEEIADWITAQVKRSRRLAEGRADV